MTDWVHAAERAYVAAATGGAAPASTSPATASRPSASPVDTAPGATPLSLEAHALAAAGAIASRYLAVGTPRSFGIIVDTADQVDAAALTLVAHRTWFAPRDIRCAAVHSGAAELAAATGGRVVSLDEALACDIVNLHATGARVIPAQLRRGTHVNATTASSLDDELSQLATFVREAGLPALAAGLVDGRQLDELTIFVLDGAPIAVAALAT